MFWGNGDEICSVSGLLVGGGGGGLGCREWCVNPLRWRSVISTSSLVSVSGLEGAEVAYILDGNSIRGWHFMKAQ